MVDVTDSSSLGPADPFDLGGRTAIVTGASSGLGQRFSRVLSGRGATVFAAARRLDRLEALAESDPGIVPFQCDVTAEEDRIGLITKVFEERGPIDILVNNAGVSGERRAMDETPEAFAGILEVNLTAPFHLACLAAARTPAGLTLSIVNIASILGIVTVPSGGGAGYAASKAGIIGLTRELAGQWGSRGVRVNAIAPGWFRSEMTTAIFGEEKLRSWVVDNTLLRRLPEAGDLDGALLFLASNASAYCTGQTIVIDGGWTAR